MGGSRLESRSRESDCPSEPKSGGGLEISGVGGFHGLGGLFSSSSFMHVTRPWIAAVDWLATELPPIVRSLILYMLSKRQGTSFLMAIRDT